jgi:U3 small nucleolar RNA-associated protein 4
MIMEECSNLELSQKGTGSATLAFTPDSNRLILGLALESAVVVVELPNEFDASMGVSRTFSLAQIEGARVTRRLPKRQTEKSADEPNGKAANGHAETNGMDVDADENTSSTGGDASDAEDDESDEEEESSTASSGLLRSESLAVSEDGQWLAVVDTNKKIAIYNLDVLKVSNSTDPS